MPPTVSLLEIEPEFGRRLAPEDQEVARRLVVPVMQLDAGSPEIDTVLEQEDACAALLLDGMVMHRMSIGGRRILRLLGPSDIIVPTWAPRSEILGSSTKCAAGHARIALLGRPLVDAARQFPGLLVGLLVRLGDQQHRLAVQMGICQLPRVQDRVLTLMWLLAESWGKVTPQGTRLPVKLTHGAIGELIGARRSTVSLALRDLVEQGALSAHGQGWLLHASPPAQPLPDRPTGDPRIIDDLPPAFTRPGASLGAPSMGLSVVRRVAANPS
jgi:CRP/FNR family cyclic AMP-dependent transcriptional regulator